mmetsp:Transcript_3655/g.11026  ORF Transcript_3655/g.11026 Transcript_3655/m.11026 type:complete len:211 (-) Transcript_3655:811-1443(-)
MAPVDEPLVLLVLEGLALKLPGVLLVDLPGVLLKGLDCLLEGLLLHQGLVEGPRAFYLQDRPLLVQSLLLGSLAPGLHLGNPLQERSLQLLSQALEGLSLLLRSCVPKVSHFGGELCLCSGPFLLDCARQLLLGLPRELSPKPLHLSRVRLCHCIELVGVPRPETCKCGISLSSLGVECLLEGLTKLPLKRFLECTECAVLLGDEVSRQR